MRFFVFFLTAWSAIFVAQLAWAQEHTLFVSGKDGARELTLAQLDALPQETFRTSTIWTEGEVEFSGVPLSLVLAAAGASGKVVNMVALNDYAVQVPFAEVGETYPIVATRFNGAPMRVRDKGPFWVVYPYDADDDFQTETTYSRSIWQLRTLSVMD